MKRKTKKFYGVCASLGVTLIFSAQVHGVEELLETLILPSPVSDIIVSGTVPLRQGTTYRIVVTGITTITTNQGIQLVDGLYFFSPVGPSGPQRFPQHVEIRVGGTSIGGLAPPELPFPPFNPDHRYERVFAPTQFINGVLGTRLGIGASSPATTTIKVELFGERQLSCNENPATIEVIAPGVPTFGTPGDDVMVGTEGDDQIFGRGGFDIICGLGGNDQILGNEGSDRLFGGPGDDILTGGDDDARDFLFGEDDEDVLRGGKGNDVLDGGPGADRMIGGPGDDRLFRNGGFSLGTIIMLGEEDDFLNGNLGTDTADYSQLPGPVRVNLDFQKQRGGEILSNIENVRGTPGDDRLTGDIAGNILIGGSGNDRLRAGRFDDRDIDRFPDQLRGGRDFDTCIFALRRRGDQVKGCEIVRGDVER